jgi:hypothetical protein
MLLVRMYGNEDLLSDAVAVDGVRDVVAEVLRCQRQEVIRFFHAVSPLNGTSCGRTDLLVEIEIGDEIALALPKTLMECAEDIRVGAVGRFLEDTIHAIIRLKIVDVVTVC